MFLFTMYNLEVVDLPKVMDDTKLYKEITDTELEKTNKIEHDVSNYVDNSTNSIGGESLEDIKRYTEQYMRLVEIYYKANKLKLNAQKTTFMGMGNDKSRSTKLKLEIGGKVLTDDLSMKILGWWVTPTNSMAYHLSKIRGPIYNIIAELQPFLKMMTINERKEVVYSKALSIMQYGLALYSGQTEEIKDRVTTIMMRGNKAIHGQPILRDTKN